MNATAWWVVAPGRGELRPTALPPAAPGTVLLRTLCTGVSPGTERLVGRGAVPADSRVAMACAHMEGSLALPVKYGYCLVGRLVDGPDAGRTAFAMHPHQDVVRLPADEPLLLPADMPPARATLVPNLETALNAVWDAELQAGERVAVVGGGIVGLLVAFVVRRLHGPVVVVEADPVRAARARSLPWVDAAVAPDALPRGAFAAVFHASGRGDGLQLAIDALAFEGRVVELSWYGDAPVTLRLGGAFHHGRLRVLSSQVGTVARSHRGTHDRPARRAAALALLAAAGDALDVLLGPRLPWTAMPELFHALYAGADVGLAPVVVFAEAL